MDLIHRKEKYNEYLKKIEKAKSDDKDYKFFEALEARSEVILKELRDPSDKREINYAIYLLAIPLIIISGIFYYKEGFNLMMIPLGLLIIFLIYYRFKMLGMARMVKEFRIDNRDKVADKDINWLKKKIEYITRGIEVKLTRLRLVKMFYMIFFPLFLVLIAQLVLGKIPINNHFLSFFAAFLIGGIFWHYFFSDEISELEDNQDDLLHKMNLLD